MECAPDFAGAGFGVAAHAVIATVCVGPVQCTVSAAVEAVSASLSAAGCLRAKRRPAWNLSFGRTHCARGSVKDSDADPVVQLLLAASGAGSFRRSMTICSSGHDGFSSKGNARLYNSAH